MKLRYLIASALVAFLAAPLSALTADDLFDSATLHEIWIHINARDWAQLRANFMENTYYPCDVEWRDVKVRNAGCRSRGLGSRSGMKPGLRVDFNRYVTDQTFLGLRSIVLDNLWQDASMIKERLSMHLFERAGLPAPRESQARLYVGSGRDYIGVYGVVEEVDELFVQRVFGERSGHLYEYRWIDEYRFEDLGPDLEPYAARFEPRTHERDSMFDLYAPIQTLVRAINETPSEQLETDLAAYLDFGPLLTHLAVENYLAEWDGLLGYAGLDNFYLYRFGGTSRVQLIAWDKDSTFSATDMAPSHNFDGNVLARKIWASARLRGRYLQALLQVAAAAADLEQEAARAFEQIRAAAVEDPLKPYSNDQFEEAVEDVKQFAKERGGIVRALVSTLGSAGPIHDRIAGPGELLPDRRPRVRRRPEGRRRPHPRWIEDRRPDRAASADGALTRALCGLFPDVANYSQRPRA